MTAHMSPEALGWDQAQQESNLELAKKVKTEKNYLTEKERLPEYYQNSILYSKLQERKKWGAEPVILFSDIDKTFFDKNNPGASQKLAEALESAQVGLIYVTGRGGMGINPEDKNLPLPDVVVSNAGTQIYIKQKDGAYLLDENFRDIMLSKQWDRTKALESLEKAVVEINNPNVKIPEEIPMEFELVLHITGSTKEKQVALDILSKYLPDNTKNLSWDSSEPNQAYAAIIPKDGGKKEAIIYLTKLLGIDYGIAAGDADIDVEPLLEGGLPGVLVGGSSERARTSIVGATKEHFGRIRSTKEGEKIFQSVANASEGLAEAMKSGWINPASAKDIVLSLYNLEK